MNKILQKNNKKSLVKSIYFINSLFYKYPLYVCVLLEWVYSIWSVYFFLNNDLSLLFLSAFVIQCGVMSTCNINVAHELMHKKSKLDQNTAWLTLLRN